MAEFRILDYNYAFEPTVDISASSEDTNFPVSNLANHHRGRPWRSSGRFTISSSNRKLDFKESGGGSEITITLDTGDYSPDALAAAIEAALETASLGHYAYTVSYASGTGLWTIATDNSYLSILFSTGSNVANCIGPTLGFAVADHTGATTYTGARIAIHTSERVVFDLQTWSNNPIDSIAVLLDPMQGYKFSVGATIKLQANQIDEWSSPAIDVTMDFDTVYDVFTKFYSSNQSYRYWSIYIVDTSNPNLYVEVPKVILSLSTQLGQTPDLGFVAKVVDQSKVSETPYGHGYVDVYPSRRTFEFNYSALTEADLTTLQNIFNRVGQATPIAVALDPTATIYDKDRFFIYGRLQGSLDVKNRFYTYFDAPLRVEEEM